MITQRATVWLLLVAAFSTLLACQRLESPNQAIERAIQEHLHQRTDLAIGQMVLEVQEVNIDGDRAEANVVFRTTTDPQAQMNYHYELRREAGVWRVSGGRPSSADSIHPGFGGTGTMQLPEGHPPIESMPGSPQGETTQDHPEVGSPHP